MTKKKILTVVGARPQFIKLAPLVKAFDGVFDHVIVHTGQHYDHNLSKLFFDELGIPEPHYNLQVGSGSASYQIANILLKTDEVLVKEKPDCVIVFGDTNSTAAAAIAAVKNNIRLAHVEAGLREFNKQIPEETNKLITDILADLYFCPTDTAIQILKDMGITDGVYNVGDVMIDIIRQNIERINANMPDMAVKYGITAHQYVFMTCHRAANTDDPSKLEQILKATGVFSEKVIFPLHPRTKKVMEENNLMQYLGANVIITEPLGYIDTQTLIRHARFVYTDSGGVTKEAYYHKVQGILTDTQTEWVETIKEGWNIQAGPDYNAISAAYHTLKKPANHSNCLGDGFASEHIVKCLLETL